MGLYRAKLADRLNGITYALALPAVVIGYIMDVLANLFIAPVIFFDPPKEWLVTTRLKRYQQGKGWRKSLADWVCSKLLDVFDPTGNHC